MDFPDRDRGPDKIVLSAEQWRQFVEACKVAGVQPTFDAWYKWRTGKLVTNDG